ncbi:hypothetical protein COCON_G00234130 [Conger conger]|uniref:E3 ubiquitin-protein ligase n=1 Tax=Conger conger TaxID=82655 RepID=A0A9Q1CUR6_CONCO|nr:hypothetical protein COCON_G00234130 [Conger conger]
MFTFHSFIKDSSINGEKFIMMQQLMGMQKQLGATQSKFQQRIQEREKELQDLRQAVQSLKRSAQAAVEDSERIFTEMIRSIERRCSEVKELIRDQETAEVSRAEGLLERLEQEIAELRRRDAELEQLSHTQDHIHFLQSSKSLCVPPGPGDLPSITVSPHVSFEAEAHPNPGKPFTGIQTQSWLLDSPEGRKVLKLLQRAFEQKLIFTVAATHGAADRVVYTDIPHDASGNECKQPGFLQRVKAALRAKGIE